MDKEDRIIPGFDSVAPKHTFEDLDPEYVKAIKARQEANKQKVSEEQEQELRRLKIALDNILTTSEGKLFFKWLFKSLGFNVAVVVFDHDSLLINETRRVVWQSIRLLMSKQRRNEIEGEE